MRELTIRGRRIADDTDAYVIAEIGGNHQGEDLKAVDLVRAAAECGADAVKFQRRHNRTLFTRAMYESPYHSEHAFGPTYGAHREALELGLPQLRSLRALAHHLGMAFGCTAFDVESATELAEIEVDFLKIASGDLTNTSLIRHIAGLGLPVVISTGGGTIEDVDRAVGETDGNLAILQCTATYPCPPDELNLSVIETYRCRYGDRAVIGLSDHQDGISLAPVAYMLGARIFEKHFTLSRSWKGSDQAFSLEPEGLRRMVKALRETRAALGDGIKRSYVSEEAGLYKMSKSIVFGRDLPAGHVVEAGDLALKSPGGGWSPYRLEEAIGRRTIRAVAEDEAVSEEVAALWD